MKIALIIISTLALLISMLIFKASKGSIHEIFASVMLLISTTSFGFTAVVHTLENNSKGK